MSIIQDALKKSQITSQDTPSADFIRPAVQKTFVKKPRQGFLRDPGSFTGTKKIVRRPFIIAVSGVMFCFAAYFIFDILVRSMENNNPVAAADSVHSIKASLPDGKPQGQAARLDIRSFARRTPQRESVLNLSGIMYLEDGPRALINNTMVTVGSLIGGARVVDIQKDAVVLDVDGSENVLKLN